MKHHFKILALLATLSTALAAPSEINYQGVLTDQQGNPVNGMRAMQIKLYDAPTGGNMTYQQNIGNVTVADGIYSFKFGSSGNGIASALNGNDHLALVVDSVEQPTRTKILAVPYALKAKESETSTDVDYIKRTLISLGILPLFEQNAIVSTLAGSSGGFADGQGTVASFNDPYGIAVDGNGDIIVADSGNNRIRKITASGNVTTLAGGGWGGSDGQGAAAGFQKPVEVAVDGIGNVYVADLYGNRIRKIDVGGNVTTLAGSIAGFADGQGTSAKFSYPNGIDVDGSGNVYVADGGNNRIRKIDAEGNVTTLAGFGAGGFVDGLGTRACFYAPQGVAVDGSGNVYVADGGNNRIRKITLNGN